MPKTTIANFDPARIPDTKEEASFHADATYVFSHLSAEIIPKFNQNLDWISGALTGDTQTILGSLNAILGGTALEIGAGNVTWGNGEHRITNNDGGGNANIRFGHYYDGGEKVSQAGGSGVHLEASVDGLEAIFSIDLLGSGAAVGDSIASRKRLDLTASGVFTWGGQKVWHAGNDGAGSGLDADTLDGAQASQFLRSDVDAVTSKSLTVQNQLMVGKSGGGDSRVNFYDDNSSTWRSILWSNAGDCWLVEDNSGAYRILWHAGNDGAGSGLDADTLDGIESAQFLRSDAADRISGLLTVGNASGEQIRVGHGVGAALDTYVSFYRGDTVRSGYIQALSDRIRIARDGGALIEMFDSGDVRINGGFVVHSGLGYSAPGSLCYCAVLSGVAMSPGDIISGEYLSPASGDADHSLSDTLTGSWRCHGRTQGGTAQGYGSIATMFERIY